MKYGNFQVEGLYLKMQSIYVNRYDFFKNYRKVNECNKYSSIIHKGERLILNHI